MNGWANTGKSFQGDTLFSTWATDGTIYFSWNDGWGASTGGGASGGCSANMGLAVLSQDMTTAMARNCMSSFGTQNQTNTGGWTDGLTWKSGGIEYINDGSTPTGLYWNVMRQQSNSPFNRANGSIMYSGDGGVTWCNPAATCSTSGAPPVANTAEFTVLPTINFIHYEQGASGTLTVDCQNLYIYAFGTTGDFSQTYLLRAARGSNLQSFGTWQYYAGAIGGNPCTGGNWQAGLSGATVMTPVPPSTVYIAGYGYLFATTGPEGIIFYTAASITGNWTQVYVDSGAGNLYGSADMMINTMSVDGAGNISLYVCFGGQFLFDNGTGSTLYSPAFRLMHINHP